MPTTAPTVRREADQGGNWNLANGTGADGTLDRCTATNTWTNGWYTPFRYPHPLVTDTPSTMLPATPTNVRIVPSV